MDWPRERAWAGGTRSEFIVWIQRPQLLETAGRALLCQRSLGRFEQMAEAARVSVNRRVIISTHNGRAAGRTCSALDVRTDWVCCEVFWAYERENEVRGTRFVMTASRRSKIMADVRTTGPFDAFQARTGNGPLRDLRPTKASRVNTRVPPSSRPTTVGPTTASCVRPHGVARTGRETGTPRRNGQHGVGHA